MKPNPSDLAVPEMNTERVRKDMRRNLEITKDCVTEIIMKDNHTLGNNPNNAVMWVKILMEEINKIHH